MKNKRIIINADGYGFTPGVNEGIVRTLEAGLVRSTSCTPNFGFLGEVGNVARRFPDVSFGIHFNLSVGMPVCFPNKVPSLVNEDGCFWGASLLEMIVQKKINRDDVVRELTAQAALLADSGLPMSHWDGHQNKHLYPLFFDSAMEVAKHFNIAAVRTHRRLLYTNNGPITFGGQIRYYALHPKRALTHIGGRYRALQARQNGFRMADRLITPGYVDSSHKSAKSFWQSLAKTLPTGISEVYCHPGFPDDLLRANAKYVDERAMEVEVLTDGHLKGIFEQEGIEIINFHEL